jgi:hypothetical protein
VKLTIPTTAEIKNTWISISTPPILHDVVRNYLITGTNLFILISISISGTIPCNRICLENVSWALHFPSVVVPDFS